MPAASALRKLGSLNAYEIKGRVGAPTVVFLHGYGANCHDLAPLARALGVPRDINWLFLNGPVAVPIGGHVEGRAWFPISISMLEKEGIDFSAESPPGMRKAREAALAALEAAEVRLGNAILGGFSQGAMMAMDLALRGPEAPLGLALLSGTLVDETNWRRLALQRAGCSFFQSHGSRDAVLSVGGAQRLETLLRECGWNGRLLTFNGEHEIPLEVQGALSNYLRPLLSR